MNVSNHVRTEVITLSHIELISQAVSKTKCFILMCRCLDMVSCEKMYMGTLPNRVHLLLVQGTKKTNKN